MRRFASVLILVLCTFLNASAGNDDEEIRKDVLALLGDQPRRCDVHKHAIHRLLSNRAAAGRVIRKMLEQPVGAREEAALLEIRQFIVRSHVVKSPTDTAEARKRPHEFGPLQQTIAVGFETSGGPSWDACGGFTWVVRFHITTASGAAVTPLSRGSRSWVVQRIDTDFGVTDCAGNNVPISVGDFYESFFIETDGRTVIGDYSYDFNGDGTAESTASGNDTWLVPDNPATCGRWTIEGWCSWFDALPVGSMAPGAVGEAGVLPSSVAAPAGLGEWTLYRYASSGWNCCVTPSFRFGFAFARNRWGTYREWWDSNGGHEKRVD